MHLQLLLLPSSSPHPYSPVLHTGVAPDGLLHVGMALRSLAGPGTLPGLDRALGHVVAITPLSAASSTSSTTTSATTTTSSTSAATATATPYSSTASSRRRGGAKATKPVLAATLEVVLGAGEGHLHPDPGFRCLLYLRVEGTGQGGDPGAGNLFRKSHKQ